MLSRGRARLLGLLLTVVFLVLALRSVDPSQLLQELRNVDYVWLLPSAVCTLLGYVLRTVRWRVILGRDARASIRSLFPVLIMGFATNNLVPGRLGEFWRAYALSQKQTHVRKTFGLASVFVERVFDGLVLLLILGLVSRAVTLPGPGQVVELLAGAIFLGATVVVGLLVFDPGVSRALAVKVAGWLPARFGQRLINAVDGFLEGLQVLRSPAVLLNAALISLAVWVCEGASYLLLARGVNLGLAGSQILPAIGLTLATINLGIMVPSSAGYVGTQEFFGKLALSAFSVPDAPALALVAVSHAIQYVLITGLGLLFFAREHVSPQQVNRIATAEAEPAV